MCRWPVGSWRESISWYWWTNEVVNHAADPFDWQLSKWHATVGAGHFPRRSAGEGTGCLPACTEPANCRVLGAPLQFARRDCRDRHGSCQIPYRHERFRVFDSVLVGDVPLVDQQARGGMILKDSSGAVWEGIHTTGAELEDGGPLSVVLAVRGELLSPDKGQRAAFVCRMQFYAGKSEVRVFFTLRNPAAHAHPGNVWDLGSGGSIFLEGFSLRVPLAFAGTTTRIGISADEPPVAAEKIYQDSSGGPNWHSANHVDKDLRIPTSFRGYRIYGTRNTPDDTASPTGNGNVGEPSHPVRRGHTAGGFFVFDQGRGTSRRLVARPRGGGRSRRGGTRFLAELSQGVVNRGCDASSGSLARRVCGSARAAGWRTEDARDAVPVSHRYGERSGSRTATEVVPPSSLRHAATGSRIRDSHSGRRDRSTARSSVRSNRHAIRSSNLSERRRPV